MQEMIFGILIGICVTNIAWRTVFYIRNKNNSEKQEFSGEKNET